MRVISGSKRGKRLLALEGQEVRPTTDRVKEALFDILQFSVENAVFLDLFAGSGQVGLEALSRGAARAVFVDVSPAALNVVRKNVELTGFSDRSEIIRGDFSTFLLGGGRLFDIAFLDPPYRTGALQKALELVPARMAPGGVVICEHPREEELPPEAGGLLRQKVYRYGKTSLTVYKRELS